MRRLLLLLAVAAGVIAVTAAPATAKTPPMTVELSDRAPDAGERVTATVRFWDPLRPRRPYTLWVPRLGTLNSMLALVAADDVQAGRPRPGSRQEPIELRYRRPATFQGSFVAPGRGNYAVVVVRDERIIGVPDQPYQEVAALAVRGGGTSSPLVPVGAVALTGIAGVFSVTRWRWRSRMGVSPA